MAVEWAWHGQLTTGTISASHTLAWLMVLCVVTIGGTNAKTATKT
jgi:hypothetical protein